MLHLSTPNRARWLLPWLLLPGAVASPASAEGLGGLVFGGNLVATSDYIYRGVSSSNNDPALQADLHVAVDVIARCDEIAAEYQAAEALGRRR